MKKCSKLFWFSYQAAREDGSCDGGSSRNLAHNDDDVMEYDEFGFKIEVEDGPGKYPLKLV